MRLPKNWSRCFAVSLFRPRALLLFGLIERLRAYFHLGIESAVHLVEGLGLRRKTLILACHVAISSACSVYAQRVTLFLSAAISAGMAVLAAVALAYLVVLTPPSNESSNSSVEGGLPAPTFPPHCPTLSIPTPTAPDCQFGPALVVCKAATGFAIIWGVHPVRLPRRFVHHGQSSHPLGTAGRLTHAFFLTDSRRERWSYSNKRNVILRTRTVFSRLLGVFRLYCTICAP